MLYSAQIHVDGLRKNIDPFLWKILLSYVKTATIVINHS